MRVGGTLATSLFLLNVIGLSPFHAAHHARSLRGRPLEPFSCFALTARTTSLKLGRQHEELHRPGICKSCKPKERASSFFGYVPLLSRPVRAVFSTPPKPADNAISLGS